MSKILSRFYSIFAIGSLILQIFTNCLGQRTIALLKLDEKEQILSVSGGFSQPESVFNLRNFAFPRSIAGVNDLGSRILEVSLFGADGKSVENKKFIDGEYLAGSEFTRWNYLVNLAPHKNHNAAAHVSWNSGDVGILMLDDLLPQFSGERIATITFDLPSGWSIAGHGKSAVEISDTRKGVFLIGSRWREQNVQANSATLNLAISGDWLFTDRDAAVFASEIFSEYAKRLGKPADDRVQIGLAKFPVARAHGNWEAETRGSNVTIISSDMPFKSQSLQRLHEQLRHELFHLWIPNGVNLTGNYDWFYEGFALYIALKIGVSTGRIRFEDFLDTLSRAHTIDSFQSIRIPLIEVSGSRVSGANTTVYARGMLVAFLSDIEIIKRSKGKQDVWTIVRAIYEKHRLPANKTDGTEAVTALLGLPDITNRYVKGLDKIDWRANLKDAGIETYGTTGRTELKVTAKPNGRQRDLLDKLGYNAWRKLKRN